MASIGIGLRGEARATVTPDKTAEAYGSGLVPVFATPAMVGLLETAAVHALAGRLDEGETTVGTWLEVSHLAATPIGQEVRAEAELVAIDGRKLTFSLRAFDEHELIGEGRHNRMIISEARFLARVRAKSPKGVSPKD
jgi:predicted thioesterase